MSPGLTVAMFVVVCIAGAGLNIEKPSDMFIGVLPVKDNPSVSGESRIIMKGVLLADSLNATADGGVLSRLLAPNWKVAGERVLTGIDAKSRSAIDRGVPMLHVAADCRPIMPGGLFAALLILND
jgi:hypothetical protein